MRLLLIACGIALLLTACGQSDETPPPDPKLEANATVPEDNVFHDQVEALNKAKAAKKKAEQRAEELDAAIEKSTGTGDDDQ